MKDLRGFGCPTCGSITLEFRGSAPKACPSCKTPCPCDKNWTLHRVYKLAMPDVFKPKPTDDPNQKTLFAERPPMPFPGVTSGSTVKMPPWETV